MLSLPGAARGNHQTKWERHRHTHRVPNGNTIDGWQITTFDVHFKVCPNIYFLLFRRIVIYSLLHHATALEQVWILIRPCRIIMNCRPLGVVHPLGLVIKREYLARAFSRTNYQAVSLMCPHPCSLKKWGAWSEMHVARHDGGDKEVKYSWHDKHRDRAGFIRQDMAVLQITADHSLFAWSDCSSITSSRVCV